MTTHANPDPRELGPKPPFKPQQQRHPGTGFAFDPPADHGDKSYTGHGLLTDRVARKSRITTSAYLPFC